MTQTTWSRILLVNDDPGTLAALKAALDDAGHDVVGCSTVAEAVICAQREPFAVALIDMQQPDETGLELLGLLRRMNGQIHVVLNAAFQSLPSEKEITQGKTITFFENAQSSSIVLNHVHRAFRAYVTQSREELKAGMAIHTAALEEQQARFQTTGTLPTLSRAYSGSLLDSLTGSFENPLYESTV
jgi:DNA-binding NtrC family response regulator